MAATHEDRNAQLSPGVAIKAPCHLATTTNITLNGEQTIDGIAAVSGDRVFVKNQTDTTANGIYTVNTGSWTREPDFDGTRDVVEGTIISVNQGATNSDTMWRVTNTGTVVFGTTTLTFERALVNDSATVTFLPSGAGAVARSVQSKLRDAVSVLDFGAVGDGVADDTAAIQAAINSFGNAYVNKAGGIFLPRGIYKISSSITINNQSGFKIEGAGKYLTVIQAAAGAAALPLFKFIDGAYCSVKGMSIYALSSGAQIGSAIECAVAATIQPTPQGMIFEELYIDGQQGGGFSSGIRFTAAIGQDNNNERSFIKNCDFFKCGTGISIEHYNSLLHQILAGVIQGCGVGISTANGLDGCFCANGGRFIQNTTSDFDIGDNSTHSIDIVNCKPEGTTGLWLRALVTTGRTDVNMLNSTYHGTINNASIDYRSSGKLLMQGCQLQQTGTTRTISPTHASS